MNSQDKIKFVTVIVYIIFSVTLIFSGYFIGVTKQESPSIFEEKLAFLASLVEILNNRTLQLEQSIDNYLWTQASTDSEDRFVSQVVRKNDTIWSIASRFQNPPSGQFIAEIIDINKLQPENLQVGQTILIPIR